jgi:hypothetical protein
MEWSVNRDGSWGGKKGGSRDAEIEGVKEEEGEEEREGEGMREGRRKERRWEKGGAWTPANGAYGWRRCSDRRSRWLEEVRRPAKQMAGGADK